MYSRVNQNPNVIGLMYYFKPLWRTLEWVRRCNMRPLNIWFWREKVWQCKPREKQFFKRRGYFICLKCQLMPHSAINYVWTTPPKQVKCSKAHVSVASSIKRATEIFFFNKKYIFKRQKTFAKCHLLHINCKSFVSPTSRTWVFCKVQESFAFAA